MKAIRTFKDPSYQSKIVDIDPGSVGSGSIVIQSQYSSINYKDALAVTGKGKILKTFPLIPGIDVSGQIVESDNPKLPVGTDVLVTGCGLGEEQDGGYAEFVRAPSEWVIALPEGLDTRTAMLLGTAGFTAGLCLYRMRQMDQTPDKGPIAITGASGGVGTLATQIFSQLGFDVVAISGKTQYHQQLKQFGASEVYTPDQLNLGSRPLEKARFGGAIDNVGGELLSGLCRHVGLWGNIVCVGLADSHQLQASVMPLILRGVSLLGISSNNCPTKMRQEIWQNLSQNWKPKQLEQTLMQEVSLKDVFGVAQNMLDRKTHGRILVDLKDR